MFGRYPGDWIWVAVLLALVAAGSATAGIVSRRDSGSTTAARTIVATSPVVPAPPTPPAQTTTTTPAKPSPRPGPSPKPPATGALAVWPARNGYTVVLASIPARGTGLAEATAKAKQALGRGIKDTGILTSANFASLHPGYYVVFAGVYATLDDAQTAARRISGSYPNAYARQVTR